MHYLVSSTRTTLLTGVGLAMVSCNPPPPVTEKAQPARAQAQPLPEGHATELPAGHPPVDGAAAAAVAPSPEHPGSAAPAGEHPGSAAAGGEHPGSAAPPQPAAPVVRVRGILELADAMQGKVAAGDPIFLMARSASTGGMIAVTRLTAPAEFPLTFSLSTADVMIPGAVLEGQVRLSARVDKDGEAMSKEPGDVVGQLAEPVSLPVEKVVLRLDTAL